MPRNDRSVLQILSYNLKHYRKSKELTQDEIANETGIALRTYQSLESGTANPTLSTLDVLAQLHQLTVQRLLTLSVVKLSTSENEFRKTLQRKFIDSDLGVLIRDFEGTALWGNHIMSKLAKHDLTKSPLNLLSIKSSISQEIIRAQIKAELAGSIQPYINSYSTSDDQSIYFRIYPTVIFPDKGQRPLYSVTYMVAISEDHEAAYTFYCSKLLQCI